MSSSKDNLSDEYPKEEEETCSSGTVKAKVYMAYLKNAGGCGTIFIVALLFVLSQFLTSAGDYFVYEWSKIKENSVNYRKKSYVWVNLKIYILK